jgi:DNA polymerase
VEAFANGEDVYKIMASAIYEKKQEEITKEERFVGKTTILGAGYGMGAQKFKAQLKTFGVEISESEARHIISVYRETYPYIGTLWQQAQRALEALTKDSTTSLGRDGVLSLVPAERSIRLPSGLLLRYDGLIPLRNEKGIQYQYKTRYGWNKIYGGKVIENVCQALARCIIGEQMIRISKRYDVVLTVHDAIACIAKEEEVKEAQAYVEECMSWTPEWAKGLPVSCESGFGKSYGDC